MAFWISPASLTPAPPLAPPIPDGTREIVGRGLTFLTGRGTRTGLLTPWLTDVLRDPGAIWLHLLAELRASWAVLAPALLVALAGLLAGRWWLARHRSARFATDARQITVLAPPTVDATGAAAVWANLIGLLRPAWRRAVSGQPPIAWEYLFTSTGLAIRLWVPQQIPPSLVEHAIEAAWPGAHTTTDPASPPLPEPAPGQRRVLVAGRLRLARVEGLPIRTQFDADPLRALLAAPTGLARGEYACVQIVTRPAAGHRVARARVAAATGSRTGTRGPARFARAVASSVLDILTPGLHSSAGQPTVAGELRRARLDRQTLLTQDAADRAVVNKIRGPQYETVIRYAVAILLPATAPDQWVQRAGRVARGRAHALASAFALFSEHNRYTRKRLRHAATVLAQRRLWRGDLLSVPELAALAHLPTDPGLPGVARAGARAIAPPPEVAPPSPGVLPLGVADAGRPRPVGLRVPDARYHLHVLGATGSGKSTLMAQIVLADADAGRGAVVIDPKGDLITDILDRLPRRAAGRVVLFDPDSDTDPPVINPLDGSDNPDRDIDNLVSVFRRVYSAFWGPRTDDVMRAACLTLRTQRTVPSLADLPRLLAEPAFRARLTAGITDPVLAGFWAWYDELTDAARSQVISPVLNKLRAFLLRPFARHAIAGGRSTVDMSAVLDGGILLARLPKGSLGEETSRLVGSLVVARTWQAATARARLPQHQRRDASLVIDEAHNFLTLPYAMEDMLAEARGYRLDMTLAHQHLGQLTRDLREGISANARSKIFFASSPEDARELARHVGPVLTEHDLTHLSAYQAAARLVVHGEQTAAFTLRTRPLRRPIPGRAQEIRARAERARRPITPRPGPGGPGPAQPTRATGPARPVSGGSPHPASGARSRPAPGDPRRWQSP